MKRPFRENIFCLSLSPSLVREGRDGCYPVGKNLTRHPELGATHVATCDNVGSICNDYIKSFLGSINVDLNPSPAFQAPSPQVARGKIRSIGNMKENIFYNKVYSPFTTHHSLIHPDTDLSLLTKM